MRVQEASERVQDPASAQEVSERVQDPASAQEASEQVRDPGSVRDQASEQVQEPVRVQESAVQAEGHRHCCFHRRRSETQRRAGWQVRGSNDWHARDSPLVAWSEMRAF